MSTPMANFELQPHLWSTEWRKRTANQTTSGVDIYGHLCTVHIVLCFHAFWEQATEGESAGKKMMYDVALTIYGEEKVTNLISPSGTFLSYALRPSLTDRQPLPFPAPHHLNRSKTIVVFYSTRLIWEH